MIFDSLVEDADMAWVMIDSTIVHAHQHAVGVKKYQNQALGRSCGGFSTKILASCDALGNSVRLLLTGRKASDYTQALALLGGMKTTAILVDRGYGGCGEYNRRGGRGSTKVQSQSCQDFDKYIYKQCFAILCDKTALDLRP